MPILKRPPPFFKRPFPTFAIFGCASGQIFEKITVLVPLGLVTLIHPHQRCGYSDLPFARKDTFLYCRVQKWVGGVDNRGTNKLYLRKRHFFVIEKYVEDAKQEEKDVPDLLEAIMRPTCLVKEELRPSLCKMKQCTPKVLNSGFDPKVKSPKMGLPMDPSQFSKRPTLFRDMWPR